MDIITRLEAIEQNLNTYFTGKSCKYGHITERYVKDKHCVGCNRFRYEKYQDRYKRLALERVAKNPEKHRVNALKYYHNNKERIRTVQAEYRKRNPDKIRNKLAKRRAVKKKALPNWANLEKIKEIYKNCPKGYQVDHIVPLQSKLVCGLHVENNLQYLTPKQNLSKGNKI